jgi:hypothetical protein
MGPTVLGGVWLSLLPLEGRRGEPLSFLECSVHLQGVELLFQAMQNVPCM